MSEFSFGVQFFFITHIFFVFVVVVETTFCPIFTVSSSLVLVSFSHCPVFFSHLSISSCWDTYMSRVQLFFGNCKCVREFGSSYSLYSSAFHFVKHQTYFAFFFILGCENIYVFALRCAYVSIFA